jgi:glycerol-3-phosphate dehydrogenase
MRLARALLTLARMHRVELPLTQALVDIHGGEDPLDAVQKLMSRKSAYETEGALR